MKNRKNLVVMIVAVLLGAALLGSAFALTNGRKARFNADGYCLDVISDETDTKVNQLSFAGNTKYTESFPASYSYKDVTGKNVKVEKESFIHYVDNSVSSFENGVIVNMKEVSKGYMEFYSLEPGMVMTRNTNGYKIDANGHDLPFDELCYEISEDKVLVGANSMTLKMGNQQPVKVDDYLEIKWIEDNIVQLATKDQAWQVVTSNSFVEFASGSKLDLFEKIALSESGQPMFSLDDMAADLKTAIPVSSTSYLEWNIPQFNITSEDGKQGEDGKEGEIGETGEDGDQGEDGKTGVIGKNGGPGENGLPGTAGGKREETLGGEGERLARISVGTVDTSRPTSASFTLKIEDDDNTLSNNGGTLEVRDASNNTLVWSKQVNLSNGSNDLTYDVTGLQPDREYIVYIKHAYEAEINGALTTGNKIFSRRNFSTSSEGLSANVTHTTTDAISLSISKSELFLPYALNVRIWNGTEYYIDYPYDYDGTLEESFNPMNKIYLEEIELGKLFATKYPNADKDFSSDIEYRIELMKNCELVSDSEDNSVIVGEICKETLSGKTLKKTPQLGGLDVDTISVERGMYKLHCNVVNDTDFAITNFVFTIRDSEGSLVDEIETKVGTVNWSYGDCLPDNIYTITVKANYYDNEKNVVLNGGTNTIVSAGKYATSKVEFVNYEKSTDKAYYVDDFGNKIISVSTVDKQTSSKYANILGDLKLTLSSYYRTLDIEKPVVIRVKNNKDTSYSMEWSTMVTRKDFTKKPEEYKYYFYVNMIGLEPNATYTFTIYGTTDTRSSDNLNEYVSSAMVYLGTIPVDTGE